MTLGEQICKLKNGETRKKIADLRGNNTFKGLSNKTKHGPLQTHETVPIIYQIFEAEHNKIMHIGGYFIPHF